MKVEFVEGLRVSDPETVELAKMVLVGKENKDIVLRINRAGSPAVGLCGDDGLLFTVRKRQLASGADIGFVGDIENVHVGVLNHIAEDYIPVIASVGADADGASYNVNADAAAGAVAAALGAYQIVFLTDVEGWLDGQGKLVSFSEPGEVRTALGEVTGGMRPKLEACLSAVDAGVTSAHIVDGRKPHSVLLELFTDGGIGTKIAEAA
jgi:acetylglutamate kinase